MGGGSSGEDNPLGQEDLHSEEDSPGEADPPGEEDSPEVTSKPGEDDFLKLEDLPTVEAPEESQGHQNKAPREQKGKRSSASKFRLSKFMLPLPTPGSDHSEKEPALYQKPFQGAPTPLDPSLFQR